MHLCLMSLFTFHKDQQSLSQKRVKRGMKISNQMHFLVNREFESEIENTLSRP
jgi:hypothetical protein